MIASSSRMMQYWHRLISLASVLVVVNCINGCRQPVVPAPDNDWKEYNGNGSRSHYSSLSQINLQNVRRLSVAWVYASGGADTAGNRSQMQCNPLIVDGILYGVSANTQVFALDASNGQEKWKTSVTDNGGTTSRGVTYFTDGKTKLIFFGAGKWLYAFDATTGRPAIAFGDSGRIDLKIGIERPGADNYVVSNTPNTIYKDLIIVGDRVAESETALLGDIRAYNVYTGKLAWTFKTIPDKSDSLAYSSWSPEPRLHLGGANVWAGMAVDREKGIVYAPTGSAAFDFYGGNRIGNNLYANCLLALDAATGQLKWYRQLVHHDIWDRDPPAPPNLVTISQNGKKIDAVVQVMKQGYCFVFDRVTGEPVFPIDEMKFPLQGVEGEHASITQPIPRLPEPFTRQSFTAGDFNSFVADRDSLLRVFQNAQSGTAYIPLGKDKMTIIFPGTDGGAQWGGAATAPDGMLYVPAKEIPVYSSLTDVTIPTGTSFSSEKLYQLNCSACHGKDRSGNHDGSYPSLLNITKRQSKESISSILQKGRGMMPSFSHLSEAETAAIVGYLAGEGWEGKEVKMETTEKKLPYRHTGYNRWYDRNGYPVSTPPWGTLTAINLNTGKRQWQVPLGEYPALTEKGIPLTGTDNYGGPLLTAGGLIFIGASRDEKFRALDASTGKIVWATQLPAAGYASPSTYAIGGKQYIVIACGGGKLNTKSGDKYVAFAIE